MCGSMIVHNASSSSGLAMACLLARPAHRKVHAILLEALKELARESLGRKQSGVGCRTFLLFQFRVATEPPEVVERSNTGRAGWSRTVMPDVTVDIHVESSERRATTRPFHFSVNPDGCCHRVPRRVD
jgi:hypothetical protein